jgi:hypothetical protein
VALADKGLSLGRRVAGRLVKPANDFGRAVSWVEECRTKHSKCKWGDWMPGRVFTPTRLIEVGPPKSACKSTYARLIPGAMPLGSISPFPTVGDPSRCVKQPSNRSQTLAPKSHGIASPRLSWMQLR